MSKIDIGTIIQEQMKNRKQKALWLAMQISCDRSNIYKLFNKRSINTDVLLNISLALDHDFFQLYSNLFETIRQQRKTK